jgi:peptidoglycan/LPS O-acetylase OafA/YrhL
MDVLLLLACLAVMCGASALSYRLIARWERRQR